jgi:hypothetical protein
MSLAMSLLATNLARQRVEVIALAIVVCGLMFELIRRRRLMERYALLWLAAGVTLLVLALWKGLLTKLAHAAGISYLPSALFAVAFLFVVAMLVHFSITISRLSDQNTVLAQRLALLQERLDQRDGQGSNGQGSDATEARSALAGSERAAGKAPAGGPHGQQPRRRG